MYVFVKGSFYAQSGNVIEPTEVVSSHCMEVYFHLVVSVFFFQEFLFRVSPFATSTPFSRFFLQGHAHLSIGELEKALCSFVRAAGGIGQLLASALHTVFHTGRGRT